MEKFERGVIGFALAFILITVFTALGVSAANFTASISPTYVNGSLINQTFNVTINNTDNAYNISQVNITLPAGFTYVAGSNTTSATSVNFTNTSDDLIWTNETSTWIIAQNGTVEYFTFNSTTPSSSGNYSVTVYVLDTNGIVNTTTLSVAADADAPAIVINDPANNSNYTVSALDLNFTATDAIDGNLTCNLSLDGSVNKSVFGADSGNLTNITVSGLTSGQHYWNVTCWDNFNRITTTNMSYFGLYSDLVVTALVWNSTENNRTGAGSNVTFKATINNTGPFDISDTVNVSLWWGDTFIQAKTNSSGLTVGNEQFIAFSPVTSDAIVTNGYHNITISVDSGGDTAEKNESNNNLTTEFLVGFNVTILNFIWKESSHSSPDLRANETMGIRLYVNYSNGDPVENLSETNFTQVCDGSCGTRNWGSTGYQGTSLSGFTNSSGIYEFNISTYYSPTDPGPGVHNITVSVSNGSYSGSSQGQDYYFLKVPSFAITFGSLMTSINEGVIDSFSIYVTNNGKDSLNYATASINDNHDYLTFAACSSSINATNDSNQFTVCSNSMTALAVTSDQNGCFIVSVGGKSNGLYFNATSSPQCVDVLETSGGSSPPGGGTPGSTCTSDSDCATGYYCSSGSCLKKVYSIAITSYTSSLSVNWSSYVITKVTVKNDGLTTFTAKLSATLSGFDVSVTPESMALNPGNSIIFTVNISAPDTVATGENSGTIKALVDEDNSVYHTKALTVTVFSTPEKEQEINETYYNYSSIIDDLNERFDRLKTIGFLNESDINEIWSLINSTIDDLVLAKDALDSGDFSTANSILIVMNTSLNNIDSKIDDLEGVQQAGMGLELSGAWFWIVIGAVVVIVAAFLVYLLMPSLTGQRSKYGHRPVIRESMLEKITRIFKRDKKPGLKKPFQSSSPSKNLRPAYNEGYEKVVSGYRYQAGKKNKVKGGFSKIKKKLKRKKPQKEVSDYFSGE